MGFPFREVLSGTYNGKVVARGVKTFETNNALGFVDFSGVLNCRFRSLPLRCCRQVCDFFSTHMKEKENL